jgi:hypothetical protein
VGVDFLVCSDCKETFPDCSSGWSRCGGCDNTFCGSCAPGYVIYNEDGYSNKTGEQLDEEEDPLHPKTEPPTTCPFCTYSKIQERDLVKFLLRMTKEEAEKACSKALYGEERGKTFQIGEPKTTDYCLECGESPTSATHINPFTNSHDYVDPREPIQ